MQANFQAFVDLVWPANGDFDSPRQGYHVTPGDTGGGTYGGIIETTWHTCQARGIVPATVALKSATLPELTAALNFSSWGTIGDALPSGVDVLVANGRMMSGYYPELFQQCLGFIGDDVDGNIGDETIKMANELGARTMIYALTGRHYAYLSTQLSASEWKEFGSGWTRRLLAAKAAALALLPS
jgi:lysozyme family protein